MNTLAINEPQLLVLAEEDKEKGRKSHKSATNQIREDKQERGNLI